MTASRNWCSLQRRQSDFLDLARNDLVARQELEAADGLSLAPDVCLREQVDQRLIFPDQLLGVFEDGQALLGIERGALLLDELVYFRVLIGVVLGRSGAGGRV